jgi:hypothetical protein
MENRSWENRKGRENSEAGIGLNTPPQGLIYPMKGFSSGHNRRVFLPLSTPVSNNYFYCFTYQISFSYAILRVDDLPTYSVK